MVEIKNKKKPRGRSFPKAGDTPRPRGRRVTSLRQSCVFAQPRRRTVAAWPGVAGERRREGCPLAFACEARSSRTGGGLIRSSLPYWENAQIVLFAWTPPLSLLIASVIVAIITIPRKKTSSSIVKEKRKAGTRAGLTKAAIVAAAAKLIDRPSSTT